MAENSTDPMDRLREVSQDAIKALGDKVMTSVGDRLTGVTDKLEGVAEGNPLGKAAVKGAKAKAEGDNPLVAGVKGAASGLKDKVTGGGGGGSKGGEATKAENNLRSPDVRGP